MDENLKATLDLQTRSELWHEEAVGSSSTIRGTTGLATTPALALLLVVALSLALDLQATGYGLLLGCLGLGALLAAVLLPRLRARVTSDRLVAVASVVFAATAATLALAHVPQVAAVALLAGGAAWMAAMSTLTVAAQSAVPAWVRGRALAVSLLAAQGGLALGGVVWGLVATHAGIPVAFAAGGATLLLGAAVTTRFALHGLSDLDLLPAPSWTLPQSAWELDGDAGPVLVTLEYEVEPGAVDAFLRAVQRLEPIRRRDGAIRWNVYHDVEDPRRWVETFVVESWLEHLRQHERITGVDRVALDAVRRFHATDGGPRVRHYIAEWPALPRRR